MSDGHGLAPRLGAEEKVRPRADGSLVLMCESGNPQLGVILTPAGSHDLIASLPGEDGHPLSAVSVHLGPVQLAALATFAARYSPAGSAQPDGATPALPPPPPTR